MVLEQQLGALHSDPQVKKMLDLEKALKSHSLLLAAQLRILPRQFMNQGVSMQTQDPVWLFSFQASHIDALCFWRQLQLCRLFLWRHGSLLVWLTYKIFMYFFKKHICTIPEQELYKKHSITVSKDWTLLTVVSANFTLRSDLTWIQHALPPFRTIPPFCVSFDLVTYLLRKFLWLTFLDHFYRKMRAY